jgi:uncharacterized membrane protein SpoIIM required for sporulation
MNKRQFVSQRGDSWRRFEQLVNKIDRTTVKKLAPPEAGEYSRLFRELCHDLATIRSRDWGRTLVSYLNDLVSRGHNSFYSSPPGNLAYLLRFLASGFPRLFRANIGYFWISCSLFFLPLAITWAVVQYDPTLANRVVAHEQLMGYDFMYSEEGQNGLRSNDGSTFGDEAAAGTGLYVQHNVGIALACFGRGILFGIGTIYTLIENGIALGAISGFIISRGHGERFLSFVISHGSFELTAIAVAGGAGLILGDSLIRPGRRTRIESLRHRGLEAIQIASGSAVMLMVAAMIEAFWSPSSVPNVLKYSMGGALWLLVFIYLTFAGRNEVVP